MTVKTANFNPKTDPKLLCTCGNQGCDKRSVDQLTLNLLQELRFQLDRPLTVTSGGRCGNHPDEARRTKPADHQKCKAVDVSVNGGLERGEVAAYGIACGFNAIGVAKTFVHLGVRDELPEGKVMMWVY